MYQPPYSLNSEILALIAAIERLLGKLEGIQGTIPAPRLRKQNQIKTIQGSLAIEGNRLSLDQVSAVLEGKAVLGPKKDILEVQNAIKLYEKMHDFRPYSLTSLKKAHAILMKNLIKQAGQWRQKDVGIWKGSQVAHVAPPAKRVALLMTDLFTYLKKAPSSQLLLNSCVFHYEFEFIHPFSDGNGRLGRFWQHRLLSEYHPFFAYVPIESLIHDHQKEYYQALGLSDQQGESTVFIQFCLKVLLESLSETFTSLKPPVQSAATRLEQARDFFKQNWFSRKDYLNFFKTIASATASRDLAHGCKNKQLKKQGDKRLSRYQFC